MLQEWTEMISEGERDHATVARVIEYLTSSDRLEGRKLKSVRAVKTRDLDTYIIERIDQPLYAVRGWKPNG